MVVRIFKTLVPFFTAFSLSVFLMNDLDVPAPRKSDSQNQAKTVKPVDSTNGWGSSGSSHPEGEVYRGDSTGGPNSPLRILAKPSAKYTDEARVNNVQGTVRLKVTMLASGEVGQITVVDELSDGLTEQAIEAARRLRFEPAMRNGVPVTKVVTIDYSFTIY